jgi:hypothetical protein
MAGAVVLDVLAANVDTEDDNFVIPVKALRTYTSKYQSALVYVKSQKNEGSYTSYTLGVESFDDDYEISEVLFSTGYTIDDD